MTDYIVVAPYEPMTRDEFMSRREELAASHRRVLAVVPDCKDRQDFARKYFANV